MPSSIYQELIKTLDSKNKIKQEILNQGGTFPIGSTFSYYPTAIYNLNGGGTPLDVITHDYSYEGDGTDSSRLGVVNIKRIYIPSQLGTHFGESVLLWIDPDIHAKHGDTILGIQSALGYITDIIDPYLAVIRVSTFLPTYLEYKTIKDNIQNNDAFLDYFGDKNSLIIEEKDLDMSTIIDKHYIDLRASLDVAIEINGDLQEDDNVEKRS